MSVQMSLDVPLSHTEQPTAAQHFYMAEMLLSINSLPKMQLHSGKQQLVMNLFLPLLRAEL